MLFAIVLIFMQAGFYLACRASANRIHAMLDFDAAITSARYAFVADADRMPRERIEVARAVPGVARVSALKIGPGLWRAADGSNRYDALLLGVDPEDHPFQVPEINAQLDLLQRPDTALFDQRGHPILGEQVTGTVSELNRRRMTVAGTFSWGAGFVTQGLAITHERTFSNLFSQRSANDIQLGLIHLEPGASAGDVLSRLASQLPSDVKVWSRAAIEARDRKFFLSDRPIGLMFTSGMVLAVLVGGIILFQVLASEITSRRSEFATLQALGYTRGQVYRLVVTQGFLYTLAAFVPASLLAFVLFRVVREVARLPMQLTAGLLLAVLAASLLMCLTGALIASRKVRSADPADLF
ncbi:MAG: FtsX-like permease family protein [Acidobacteriota bacterium]